MFEQQDLEAMPLVNFKKVSFSKYPDKNCIFYFLLEMIKSFNFDWTVNQRQNDSFSTVATFHHLNSLYFKTNPIQKL
jgi:hypothetical protein